MTSRDGLDGVRFVVDDLTGVDLGDLHGFFEGWPEPPPPEALLAVLRGSTHVVLARAEGGAVVGFITALSDGVMAAYLPLLEVRPRWRGRGVGSELVHRMLDRLGGLYMVDAVCDPELVPFYERFGLRPATAMCRRDRTHLPDR